jgi:hypothetical protein
VSEKRQGTKSREIGYRSFSRLYGDSSGTLRVEIGPRGGVVDAVKRMLRRSVRALQIACNNARQSRLGVVDRRKRTLDQAAALTAIGRREP